MKLPDLEITALLEISDRARKLIEDKKEKKKMEETILDYKRRIEELERKIHESKKN